MQGWKPSEKQAFLQKINNGNKVEYVSPKEDKILIETDSKIKIWHIILVIILILFILI